MSQTATKSLPRNDVMRVGIGVSDASDEQLRLAAQMGCSGVVIPSPKFGDGLRFPYEDLVRLRERVESFGIRLEAIPKFKFDLRPPRKR